MTSSELLKKFPTCPSREDRYCEWISAKLGRLYSVTPVICNFTCRRHGPHCGKPPADEPNFLRQMWERNSPVGDNALARRVASNYERPASVHIPSLWPKIRDSLDWLYRVAGFGGIMLTGSIILRHAETLKDLDIVLRFDSIKAALSVASNLPSVIEGIKTDFFYYIGEQPDVYFACLDCETRELFVSRWLPLKIESIEPGIRIVERGTNTFGQEVVKRLAAKEVKTVKQAKSGWLGVWREWRQLTSFVAAARSRGILATARHVAGLGGSDGFHCDDSVLQRRRLSCFGDVKTLPCPMLAENAAKHKFCGACQCGQTEIARLDADTPEQYSKLHYPVLRCPLNRDGFTT